MSGPGDTGVGFRSAETPAHNGLKARVEGVPRGGGPGLGQSLSGRGAVPLHPESPPRALRPPAPDYSDREVVRWKEEDCGAREWAAVVRAGAGPHCVGFDPPTGAPQRDAGLLRKRMFQTGFVGVSGALSGAQVSECYRACAETYGQLRAQLGRVRESVGEQHVHDASAATRVFRSVGIYAKDHSPAGAANFSLEFLMPGLQRHAYLHHDSPWMPFCRSVLGPDAVTLLIGCLWAEPGAERGTWHSEGAHLFQSAQVGFALPPHAVTVSVPLVDVRPGGNGAPQFVPGSHWHPYHHWGQKPGKGKGLGGGHHKGEAIVELNMEAGSAVLADYRLHSRSAANVGDQPRCILYALVARPWFRDLSTWSAGAYLMFQPLSTLQEQSDLSKEELPTGHPASIMDLDSISASHAEEGRGVSNVLRQYGYDKDGEELENLIQNLVVSFFQGDDQSGDGKLSPTAISAQQQGGAPGESPSSRPASPSLRRRDSYEEISCRVDDGEQWLRRVFGLLPDHSDEECTDDLMDASSASKRLRLAAIMT